MRELWGSGTVGRIAANIIWALSFVVALYLLYITYKYVMRLIAGRKVKKVTVQYAVLYDLLNPYAKGEVEFGIEIPEEMEVTFQIVDRDEQVKKKLMSGKLGEGVHPFIFDTSSLNDGEYFYQLITDVQKNTKKFFIVNNR